MADTAFFVDGSKVMGRDGSGGAVCIAAAESASWAETIADALNGDPDAYIA